VTDGQSLAATGALSGIPVERTSLAGAVSELLQDVTTGSVVRTRRFVNAYTFALADKDPAYHALLSGAGVNLPDGRPLVGALNRLDGGAPAFAQVRGPSFFVSCLEQGRERGVRHFFLGGSPELLESLKDAAGQRFPGIQIVGMFSPPFRALTDAERTRQDAEIRASGAQVVWVGLGTPKQDFEARRICDDCGVTTAAVGAAFDYLAGTKSEAPGWMRRMSLEWLFRLMVEPGRLWRRYLFGNARFVAMVLRERSRRR